MSKELDSLLAIIDEEIREIIEEKKMTVAQAIKAKKARKRRSRTAAGKKTKRLYKIKTSRSSYRPNKKKSRSQKKAQRRVRRNIPKVSA